MIPKCPKLKNGGDAVQDYFLHCFVNGELLQEMPSKVPPSNEEQSTLAA